MLKLKIIWDFMGPDGEQTAVHHEIHLKEFLSKESIPHENTGVEASGPGRYSCFVILMEDCMPSVRDALRPHRAEVVED